MQIKIRNSGNISNAILEIKEDCLNIKYGSNGIGKSTLAKSIYYHLTGNQRISDLITYGSSEPVFIELSTSLQTCIYFDKEYVEKFLFQEDIQNNSYEIVVKTDNYSDSKKIVENRIKDLKDCLSSTFVDKFIKDITDFDAEIKFKETGEIDAVKKIGKGLKSGNFDQCIGEKILKYKKYIIASDNYKWSTWFEQGIDLIKSDECPFCLNKLHSKFDEEKVEILKSFNSSRLKDNLHSKSRLSMLSTYTPSENKDLIISILTSNSKPTIEQSVQLKQILELNKVEMEKLIQLSELNPLKLIENLIDNSLDGTLSNLKLNENYFTKLGNDLLTEIQKINSNLDSIIRSSLVLKTELGKLNGILNQNIRNAKAYINDFLTEAGIPYQIEIEAINEDKYRSVLKSTNVDFVVTNPKDRLSFGEQNAIALVLFSVEANAKNPDLIILDDPISSYDQNKKYAIIHQLFKSNEFRNFYGRTTLLMTHDLSPVIDIVKNGLPNRSNSYVTYLTAYSGNITEKEITGASLRNSIVLEMSLAKNSSLNILSRLIHLRRYLELTGMADSGEYHVLSSLIHNKKTPKFKSVNDEYLDFEETNLNSIFNDISNQIESFNYSSIFDLLNDNENLKLFYNNCSSYEKLNIIRFYIQKNGCTNSNKILWKYICESYHIENEYIYNLDSSIFDLVPEYIILQCDEIINVKP